MFNNLQSLNKSSGADLQKSEVIKSRLNELVFPLFNPENAFTLIALPEK